MLREAEKGTLDGLRSAPLYPETLFLAKLTFIYIVTLGLSLAYAGATAFLATWYELASPTYLAMVAAASLFVSAVSALTGFMVSYSTESRNLLGVVVMACLSTPYLALAGPALGYAAQGIEPDIAYHAAAAAAFTAIAVALSKPLVEA